MKYIVLQSSCLLVLSLLSEGRRGPHHPQSSRRRREAIDRGDQQPLVHDKIHIEEDSHRILSKERLEAMTDEELEFYYFSLHDFDQNSKLDGLEMLKAIYHTDEDHSREDSSANKTNDEDFDSYIFLVDTTLESEDVDNDGYVSYGEYHEGRKRMKEREMKVEVQAHL